MFPTENNVQWQATQSSRLKLWNGYLARTSSQPKLGFLSESIVRILEQKIIFTENWNTGTNQSDIYFLTLMAEAFIHPFILWSFICSLYFLKDHFSDVMDTRVSGLQSGVMCYLEKSDVEIIEVCCDGTEQGASGAGRSLISGRVPCLHPSGRPGRQNVSSFNFIII